MKIWVGINVLTQIASPVVISLCQQFFRMGKCYPNTKFYFYAPHRVSIDNMRNWSAQQALAQECDYLMFIDDDMVLHESGDTFKSLLEADKDIVMAHSFMRGYPYKPMCFKDPSDSKTKVVKLPTFDDYKSAIDENGLFEVDAVGFTCVLIKCELLKKMDPPYFVTLPNCTEDIYFCLRIKNKLGRENVKIFVDTKVPTGHLLEPEVISESTRQGLVARYELEYPPVKENNDRGDEYLKQLEESMNEA